jgi:OOP family OmpA-OmpF porin
MHSIFTRGGVMGLLLAPAFAAPVNAGEVRMFDRPPTVSEVQELLTAPAPAPRYRGIEIIGDAAKPVRNNETQEPRQVMPVSVMAPVPMEEAGHAPDLTAFGFRINFRFDSAVIPADAYEYLDTVGAVLHSEPDVSIVVEGHTDANGGDAYNMNLSERRAKAVETYLVGKHRIAVSRIHTVGKGEGEPLTANPFDQTNRRVQFARAK